MTNPPLGPPDTSTTVFITCDDLLFLQRCLIVIDDDFQPRLILFRPDQRS